MVEPVDRDRVDGTDNLQHSVKVVELLENLQNLYDPRHHGHPLLQVHRLDNTPENDQQTQLQLCFPPSQGNQLWISCLIPWTHFSNHSVRLVVWRIMRSKLGEFFSLSSLVQTLPTSSDGRTALWRKGVFIFSDGQYETQRKQQTRVRWDFH